MIHEEISKEHQKLHTQISNLEKQIQTLPKGKLFCTTNGKYHKWYHTTQNGTNYIPKKNRKLAEQLALKKLLTLQLEDAKHSAKALEFSMRHYTEIYMDKVTALFSQPGYHELLTPYFTPTNEDLAAWATAPYITNTSYPEQLQYKTTSGILVRSKSETIIEFILHTHQIPYRYECPLKLSDGVRIYPDFTILKMPEREEVYLEHFGMMDDADYAENALHKLNTFEKNKIYLGVNLFITHETSKNPLNTRALDGMLRKLFCEE